MIELYKVPRNSRIDISHLDLTTIDGEKVNELDFEYIDDMAANCIFKGNRIQLLATVKVKVVS